MSDSTKAQFIAKPYGTTDPKKAKRWGVYDVERASWPILVTGFGRVAQEVRTEAEAQAEADRLAEHMRTRGPR